MVEEAGFGHGGPELPEGTLTFLFTDVEGSTALWHAGEAEMLAAMLRHHELVSHCADRFGGHCPRDQGEGDARLLGFTDPVDAVRCAAAIVGVLATETWPTPEPVRVRIGLHTGAVVARGGNWFGSALAGGARVRALASGGQVLLSRATYEVVRHRLDEDLAVEPAPRAVATRATDDLGDVFELRLAGPAAAGTTSRKVRPALLAGLVVAVIIAALATLGRPADRDTPVEAEVARTGAPGQPATGPEAEGAGAAAIYDGSASSGAANPDDGGTVESVEPNDPPGPSPSGRPTPVSGDSGTADPPSPVVATPAPSPPPGETSRPTQPTASESLTTTSTATAPTSPLRSGDLVIRHGDDSVTHGPPGGPWRPLDLGAGYDRGSRQLHVAPDRRRVAFLDSFDPYVLDLETGTRFELPAPTGTIALGLSWSPDGRLAIWERHDHDRGRQKIRIVDGNRKTERLLEHPEAYLQYPVWAADGRRIYLGVSSRLAVADAATGTISEPSTTSWYGSTSLAPDGERYAAKAAGSADGDTLLIGSVAGGEPDTARLHHDGRPLSINGLVQWSPDGRTLAVQGRTDQAGWGVYLIDVSSFAVRSLDGATDGVAWVTWVR